MLSKSLRSSSSNANPNAWDLGYAYYDVGDDAWDISKASLSSGLSVDPSAVDSAVSGLFFKPDGTKMYIMGNNNDIVAEYTLSTAWLITTASYVRSFSIASQQTAGRDLFFKPDGTKMYIVGDGSAIAVDEYSLSTAWNVSTASYTQRFTVSTQETVPHGLFFKTDGTKMYVIGTSGDDVNEYSLSTAWNISTASYVQNFSIASQDTQPLSISFKSDGTKMYILGGAGTDINQYSLSTAWDISTATYVTNFSVASQDNSPQDIFFKPDGLKMYVIGSTNDSVYEYNLSTAWDVSTCSHLQTFSVTSQETVPNGLFFKPDGTKMYVIGSTGDDVNEYSLSTAWNISTASYVRVFSVQVKETAPRFVSFSQDGTKFYVGGTGSNNIFQYNLSTAWNVSTASFSQQFSVFTQDSSQQGFFFKPDGSQFFVVGSGTDKVFSYKISAT